MTVQSQNLVREGLGDDHEPKKHPEDNPIALKIKLKPQAAGELCFMLGPFVLFWRNAGLLFERVRFLTTNAVNHRNIEA